MSTDDTETKSYNNPAFQPDADDTPTDDGKVTLREDNNALHRVVVGAEHSYPPEKDAGALGNSYRVSQSLPNGAQPPLEDPAATEEQHEEEDDDEDYSLFSFFGKYASSKGRLASFMEGHDTNKLLKRVVLVTLACLYFAYFIAVLAVETKGEKESYWCDSDGFLIILTVVFTAGIFYFKVVKALWGDFLYERVILFVGGLLSKVWGIRHIRIACYLALVVAVAIFIVADTWEEPHRLTSVFGVFVLLLFGFVFSTAPRKVRWRHVAWGMSLQFLLGLLILRWPLGHDIFSCVSDKVATFLAFTDVGTKFMFGDLADWCPGPIFAFSVLPVILFFSFCIQILYYYGVMQWVVLKLGWFLQLTIGTTACESVNAAANIFLGQTEAPLLIKPYIPVMTKSELHAVMTGGFATIAGSVLAAYISFGVNASHLLSASVMSAPAALAFAKLFYPETKQSRTSFKDIQVVQGEETNLLHAALNGVTNAIPLMANIAANLIAFYAFIALCSSIFDWGCTLAGAEQGVCSLESLFGWIFMPLAWVMGVEWSECGLVGELIGLKTIVNEFVAYDNLIKMKKAGLLSKRAEIIATYALCGFSNISSIGINLGGFGAMAPSRRADLAKVVVRAMIAGSCACFLTACVAGTLLSENDGPVHAAAAASNGTTCRFYMDRGEL